MSKIVIDGNIGSGKSTVLNFLKDKASFNIIKEDVDDWKPFLDQFYSDMNKFSLSFQMKVLLHHIHTFNLLKDNEESFILERSPLSCIHIFGKSLEEQGFLSSLDISLMKDYNRKLGWYPDYLIYIKTDPEICLKRIKERNRSGETISIDYLSVIHGIYNNFYLDQKNLETLGIKTKIMLVDGNKPKDEVYEDVIKCIQEIQNIQEKKE